MKIIKLTIILFLSFSCGVASDYQFSVGGACPLDCSNALPATSNMKLTLYQKESYKIDCSLIAKNTAYSRVPILFKIEKSKIETSLAQAGGGTTTPPADDSTDVGSMTPVPSINFQALVLEGYESLNKKYPRGFNNVSKYKGIVTPPEEFCTDLCGTGVFNIEPFCTGIDQDIKILLQSGSISKMVTLQVTNLVDDT